MSGILLASSGVGVNRKLDATVTAVDLGGGLAGYVAGSGGSMDDDDFADSGGTTRTIVQIYGDGGADTVTKMILSGASVPNSDTTFSHIVTDAGILTRAAATYNGADGGDSSWTWGNGSFVGGAGSHSLEVWA